MSSTLNEIANFLAKPIPLGLMLVFFFVSLAVFSLFLGRVEARNREVQLHYQEQIYALTQQRGQTWAGSYEPTRMRSSGGGWLGWVTVLALVICGGVVIHASQKSASSELVVPEIAGLGSKAPEFTSVKPGPALVKASAVAPKAEPEPAPSPQPVTAPAPVVEAAPAQLPAKAPPAPEKAAGSARNSARSEPSQQQGPDQDIERMLARERKRAARRRQGRSGGSRSDAWVPERPKNRRSPATAPRPQRSTPTSRTTSQAPRERVEPNKDVLLPETSLPKKRRRRLKLDRSNDPLGSL